MAAIRYVDGGERRGDGGDEGRDPLVVVVMQEPDRQQGDVVVVETAGEVGVGEGAAPVGAEMGDLEDVEGIVGTDAGEDVADEIIG